jgi:hypothetical protein
MDLYIAQRVTWSCFMALGRREGSEDDTASTTTCTTSTSVQVEDVTIQTESCSVMGVGDEVRVKGLN